MPIRAVVNGVPPTTTPISQATYADLGGLRLVFVSGQVGRNPDGTLAGPGIEEQLPAVYANLGMVVKAAGGSMADIVMLRTYLAREADLPRFRDLRDRLNRGAWGPGPYPTNTLLVVKALAHADFAVEIEAIAAIGGDVPG